MRRTTTGLRTMRIATMRKWTSTAIQAGRMTITMEEAREKRKIKEVRI